MSWGLRVSQPEDSGLGDFEFPNSKSFRTRRVSGLGKVRLPCPAPLSGSPVRLPETGIFINSASEVASAQEY